MTKTVFFSNEETETAITGIISRLGLMVSGITFLYNRELKDIAAYIRNERPDIAVLDSLQTVTSSYQSQVDTAKKIKYLCDHYGCSFIIIGHINKEDNYSGTREIEHTLDVIIEMKKGGNGELLLHCPHKNRMTETGKQFVSRMTQRGLVEKTAIEKGFLLRHTEKEAIGTAAFCSAIKGDITVDEITVTVNSTLLKPKLTIIGMAPNQSEFLASVIMSSFTDFMPNYIVRANRSTRLTRSSDLACVIGVLSTFYMKPIPLNIVFLASVDASGTLLQVEGDMVHMAKEAIEQGYAKVIGPKATGSQQPNWEEAGSLTDVWKMLGY